MFALIDAVKSARTVCFFYLRSQRSRYVSANGYVFLCDKSTVLGAAIKETSFIIQRLSSRGPQTHEVRG